MGLDKGGVEEVSMAKYWKKKLWEEYGVKVKKIRHFYNPLTSYGFAKENYIVYYFVGGADGALIQNYDKIFHDPKEIVEFLESESAKR